MIDEKLELDCVLYFLEEARRRAGNLRGAELPQVKSFAQDLHSGLTSLIRMLNRVEGELERGTANSASSQARFKGL